MLVISKMNMDAIRINASVHPLTKLSLVSSDFCCRPSIINRNLNSGDIAVSRKTVHKLMKISGNSNTAMVNAFSNTEMDLWDQNVVNGEFVIAYVINPGLDQKLQNMLPKVYFLSKVRMLGLQNFMQGLSIFVVS